MTNGCTINGCTIVYDKGRKNEREKTMKNIDNKRYTCTMYMYVAIV